MTTTERQTMVHKTLQRKLKIEQHEPIKTVEDKQRK